MNPTTTAAPPMNTASEDEVLLDYYLESTRRVLEQLKADGVAMKIRQDKTQAHIDELLHELQTMPRR